MARRLCSVVVLSLVVSLGQASVPLAAQAAQAAPSAPVSAVVDDDGTLVKTAGPLGGLPAPVDAADRIDSLPVVESLPEGEGAAGVDGSWSAVPGVPVSVRESADGELPVLVDEVEVSVAAPVSEGAAAGESADSLLVAVTPVTVDEPVTSVVPSESATPSLPLDTPAPRAGLVSPTASPSVTPVVPTEAAAETPSTSETAAATEPTPGSTTGPIPGSGSEEPAVTESPATGSTEQTPVPAEVVPTEAVPAETPGAGSAVEPEPEPEQVPGVEVRVDYAGFAQAFGGGWADRLSVVAYPACFAQTPEVAACAVGVPVEAVNDPARGVLRFSTTDGTLVDQVSDGTDDTSTGDSGTGTGAADGADGSVVGGGVVSQRSVGVAPVSGVVFAVSAEAGNYAATPVPVSSSWQVGTGSGEFSYSYPFVLPSVMGAPSPGLGLSYSSGSVDSMTSAANGQAGQAGLGWDMSTGFITRSYASCEDDGHPNKGDWCWKSRADESPDGEPDGELEGEPGGVSSLVEDYRIVLAGQSSRLIRVGVSNQFRLARDPGWRVTLLAGGAGVMDNDDNNDEGFVVESPDGTRYFFGSGAGANSVWTVPVFGNNAGEPCHKAEVSESWCDQAWRWNLDKSIDSLGRKIIYTYKTENNHYGLWGNENNPVRYDRAGYLDEISYGLKGNEPTADARARVTVYSGPRCNVELDGVGNCLADGNGPRQAPELWPDVPTDLICDGDGPCYAESPSFFSIHRYVRLVTQTIGRGDAGDEVHSVDRYDLSFTMPDPDKTGTGADAEDGPDEPDLWLNSIRRTGLSGNTTEVDLPQVQFNGVVLRNKVTAASGARRLVKFRIDEVRNEMGGRVQVRYGHADGMACDADYVAGRDRWASDRECFAQRWAPPSWDGGPNEDPPWTWFHKYVVTRVALADDAIGYRLGAGVDGQILGGDGSVLGGLRVYDYDYNGAPGWRFENSPLRPTADESWTDWRGYGRTWIHTRKTGDNETIQSGDVALQRVLRFRGLSGGPDKPGGDPVEVKLGTDDDAPVDHGWLEGQTAETVVFDPDGADEGDPTPLSRTLNTYDWFATVDPDVQAGQGTGLPKARIVWADSTTTITSKAGGERELRSVVTTDVDKGGLNHRGVRAGAVTQVQQTATGTNATCTTSTWVATSGDLPENGSGDVGGDIGGDDDRWIRAPHEQITTTVTGTPPGAFEACDDGAATTARTITYYDGNNTGAGITKGLPTRTLAFTGPDGDPGIASVSTSVDYDNWGRVIQTVDPKMKVSKVAYEPTDGLTTRVVATNPLKHKSTTVLEPWRGQPVETIDANEASTRIRYDALGRLVAVRKPGIDDNETPSIAYDYTVDPNHPSQVKTSIRRTSSAVDTSHGFSDGWGRTITTLTPSVGGSDTDTQRWVASVTGYDEQGLTRFTVPAALTANLAEVNIILDEEAPRYTKAAYDAAGRMVTSTDMFHGNPVATTRWSYRGDTTVTNPPVGGDTLTVMNGLGQTTRVDQYAAAAPTSTTPGSTVFDSAAYTYTAAGALASIKAAHQVGAPDSTWSYTYDWLGQRQTASDPDTGVSSYDYDESGNLTTTTSPAATTVTKYDDLGRPTSRWDGKSAQRASWTYDTAVADTNGTYLVGRPVTTTTYTDEGTYVTRATGYEPDGDLKGTTATWPAKWTSPDVDMAANPPITASATVSYDYNDASQLTRTDYGQIYREGNLGLPARNVTHSYTTGGLWAQSTTDGGNTILGKADYNWRNQPIGINSATEIAPTPTSPAGGTMRLDRSYSWQDDTGYLDTLTGTVGNPSTAGIPTSSLAGLSLKYGYDPGGNVRTIDGKVYTPAVKATDGTLTTPASTSTGRWCYSYDGLNRLATAQTGDPDGATKCTPTTGSTAVYGVKHDLAYTYTRDGLASVTDRSPGAGATVNYTYPLSGDLAANRPVHGVVAIAQTGTDSKNVMPLAAAGIVALAYDPAGRITTLTKTDTSKPSGPATLNTTWYTYDTLGNLSRQTTGQQQTDGERVTTDALYDADGIRILRRTTSYDKKNVATTTNTFYLGDVEISHTAGNKSTRTLQRTYTTPGGVPIATETNPGTGVAWTWLLADQQHSIRLVRNAAGIKRTNYLPAGAPVGPPGNTPMAPGNRGYLNKTHDPTGDIRLDHRNYTPTLNILTTPDPLLTPYDPQNLNPYTYARNNAITHTDPTGLSPEYDNGDPVAPADMADYTHALDPDFTGQATAAAPVATCPTSMVGPSGCGGTVYGTNFTSSGDDSAAVGFVSSTLSGIKGAVTSWSGALDAVAGVDRESSQLGGIVLNPLCMWFGTCDDAYEMRKQVFYDKHGLDETSNAHLAGRVAFVGGSMFVGGGTGVAAKGARAGLGVATNAVRSAAPSMFTRAEALSGRASQRTVNEIAESMRANGWLGAPIDVVELQGTRIVVDGHHRLAAARRAGIDVLYRVVNPSTVVGPGRYTSIDDILESTFSVGRDRLR